MKRTIVFSNYDDLANPYYAGGGARAIHEVAKRLVSSYHVIVLVGSYPGSVDRVSERIRYLHVGPKHLGSKLGQICFQLALPFYALKLKYDVWFDSFTPPISLGLLPLLSPKPVVGLIHMLPGGDMRRKYYLPFDHLERLTLKLYRHFITTSTHFADIIKHLNPRAQIVVAANGVNMPSKSSTNFSQTHLLFLGRIEVNQKGIDLLIHAYSAIQKRINLPLVIAGNGTKSEMLKMNKMIAVLGLKDHVHIVGKQEENTKDKLIRAAACVIVPSRFETFSLVSLETMAYSVPLVTFDIDELGWIPSNLRFIAHSFDVLSLSKTIVRAINKSSMQKKMVVDAAVFAKKLDWEKTAKLYKLTIEGLLS